MRIELCMKVNAMLWEIRGGGCSSKAISVGCAMHINRFNYSFKFMGAVMDNKEEQCSCSLRTNMPILYGVRMIFFGILLFFCVSPK